jgi:hypothetical protein
VVLAFSTEADNDGTMTQRRLEVGVSAAGRPLENGYSIAWVAQGPRGEWNWASESSCVSKTRAARAKAGAFLDTAPSGTSVASRSASFRTSGGMRG